MSNMTSLPGPRYKWQGEGSGEEFRDDHLLPAFCEAESRDEPLIVDMDGAPFGYPTSFLEEAFGGLSRKLGTERVQKRITITSTTEERLIREIEHYIRYGEADQTPPFIP